MFHALWSLLSKSVHAKKKANRRSLSLFVEPLESRNLMAGDLSSLVGIGTDTGRILGQDVATDAAGNTYIAGTLDSNGTGLATSPIDLDPAQTYGDNRDIVAVAPGTSTGYFAKFLPDGTLDWVRRADRSTPSMQGTKIVVAPQSGGIYFAGINGGTLTVGDSSFVNTGFPDRFAGKINADGTFAWVTTYAAAMPYPSSATSGLAVNEASGRLYVAGLQMLTNPGTQSGTVIALNFSNPLNVVVDWKADLIATSVQGASANIRGVAVDSAGNVVSVGYLAGSADFDPGPGKTTISTGGRNPPAEHFVWKLTAAGNFVWVKQFEAGKKGGGYDMRTVAVDPADAANNIYVAGSFSGTVDFQPGNGTVNMTSTAGGNAFLVKMSSAGTVAYARQYGGAGDQVSRAIAFDATGVYLVGGTVTPNGLSSSIFVSHFDKTAGTASWQTSLQGQTDANGFGQMHAIGIAVNSVTNQVHVVGWYKGTIEADGDVDPELDSGDATEDLFWLTLNVL